MGHTSRTLLAFALGAASLTIAGSVGAQTTTAKESTASASLPDEGVGISRLPIADAEQFADRKRGSVPWTPPAARPGARSQNGDSRSPVEPQAFGDSTAPYTTTRLAVTVRGVSDNKWQTPVTSYPYRATGKLRVRFGTVWGNCTASLIRPGVLITAAHCIFNYGQGASGWADEARFYPARYGAAATSQPYGTWQSGQMRIPTPYFNGTDTCTQAGVVCNNDIATIVLNRRAGIRAGDRVGWYNWGWNGYSYVNSTFFGRTVVNITQLGYPVAFDGGQQMIRTDAAGWYHVDGNLLNTQIGSAQTGGSSGGPWLVNFGTVPTVSSSASLGQATVPQVIVGVTSYGRTSQIGFNRQGASFFGQNNEFPDADYGGWGAGNIGKILLDTCTANPNEC